MVKHDDYTPEIPDNADLIFFRDADDASTDASAGIGVSHPSGICFAVSAAYPQVTAGEITAGTETGLRMFSPADVSAMALEHGPAGGGGGGGGNEWSDPVSSNIVPDTDTAYDLGSAAARFKEIWVSGIHTFSSIDLRGQVFENVGPTSSTLSGVSTAERTAGTETDFRLFSPADISSMVIQHETGGGGGSLTESGLHDLISGLDLSSIQSNDEFLFRVASGTDELAVTTASGIVDKGLTDLGIDPQNRITDTRDPNANDDGAGTNGVVHIINDLWTNTSTDEAFICLDITTSAAVWSSITATGGGGVTDHGALTGLSDDDHTQYLLTDGTRTLTGNQDFGGNVADNYGPLSSTLSAVSTAEITAGTSTEYRVWSPADVSAAVIAHETGGGGGVTDHGALTGLSDDDHSQYLLTDGTRTLTGNQDFGGNVADNYGAASSTLSAVSTDEITAGTSTEYRVWSPADLSAMIVEHQIVPELYVPVPEEISIQLYVNPNNAFPQRLGTNNEWGGFKVNLTEYDEFQVRGTYESGDNSGIVIGVGCTSGSTPFNRTNPAFSIGDGQGAPYEYIHSGQLGADAVVSGGVSFDGVPVREYKEGAWTPLDPSVKRECGLAFMYLEASGTSAGNRTWSKIHVAFRRNLNYR